MSNSLQLPRLRTHQIKKALSIAIRYSHLRSQGFELAQAHRDSNHIVKLLRDKFGYQKENITVLKDSDDGRSLSPTRANILQAMEDLVSGSMRGDHLICHISGHGSQRPCPIPGQEKDGMDEIFWPVDVEFHHDDVRNYILDDEIKEILVDKVPPGVNLVIIADCCHSGTIADLPHGHTDHTPRTNGLRIEGKGFSGFGHELANFEPNSAITEPDEAEIVKGFLPNVICWSACKDEQTTYSPSNSAGLFIQLLAQAISEDASQTHQEVLHKVTEMIDNLIAKYNEKLGVNVQPPKPHLSSLCYQTEILGIPISKAFGKSLNWATPKNLADYRMILSPAEA